MTEDELLARFEDCTLGNEHFHHADHVRIAFLYLSRHSALEALQHFSCALRKFADAKGKPELYHETITWAFVFLIGERMARTGSRQSWEEFSAANADLLHWKDGVLKKYYRDETLWSDLARRRFVFPDRVGTSS